MADLKIVRLHRVHQCLTTAAVLCLVAVVARNLGLELRVPLWDHAYDAVALLAVAICGVRAWSTTGAERAASALFGLGLLLCASADIYFSVVLMDLAEIPYPSLADVGYLGFYPPAYAGLVLLLRARAPRLSSGVWLDGILCALAGAAVGAALVLNLVASTRRLVGDGRHQYRLSAGRRDVAVVCRRRVVRRRARCRHDVAAARRGIRRLGDRGRDLPHPGGAWHLRGVHAAGHGMAAVRTADRARGGPPAAGDEFCVAAPVYDRQLLERAREALCAFGEGFEVRCSYGTVALGLEATDASEALRVADQRMYANKRGGRRSSGETVHEVLLRVAAEHDGELRDHVDDVAVLAEVVARELQLSDAEVLEVRRAAALHDIGKVAIPDSILQAPRALTEDEWRYMRRHTLIGERIIAAAPELAGVARIVRSSHERYDGGGYPDGLATDEIPLGARIVAVCDSYDAIVSDRAYRSGRTHEEALAELSRCAGTQFDPEVVAAFRMAQRRDVSRRTRLA